MIFAGLAGQGNRGISVSPGKSGNGMERDSVARKNNMADAAGTAFGSTLYIACFTIRIACPSSTPSPGLASSSCTVPPASAITYVFIFMASTMAS